MESYHWPERRIRLPSEADQSSPDATLDESRHLRNGREGTNIKIADFFG